MNCQEIKIRFDIESINENQVESIIEKINSNFNLKIDENFKPYLSKDEKISEYKDLSNLNQREINKNITSFFKFTYNKTVNCPLSKFLFLKNKDKLIILANIHISYLDYIPLKKIYPLFNNKDFSYENNLNLDYIKLKKYLNSSDFKKDEEYWKNQLSDIGEYIKFYNLKTNNYKSKRATLKNQTVKKFIKKQNISKFEFITGIFSLYLSRIDRTKGCLLKTLIHENKVDKKSLVKIKYHKNNTVIKHLTEVKTVYKQTVEKTKVNINYYTDKNLSYYSIQDLTKFKNLTILNTTNDALTLNVYEDDLELIYNTDIFTDEYINHMMENILTLIDNLVENPNQECWNIEILSSEEKNTLSNFSKGKTIKVDKEKTLAMAFHENALKYPDLIAIDDGINEITYKQLELSTNSIAYDLNKNYNIGHGDCVALMLPRTYHFGEIVLALNKIGAIFTPIDPEYPLKRIEHMINISESTYIITTKEYNLKDLGKEILYIEDLNKDYNTNVKYKGSVEDLFAIIFTSGTTGIPKGVMVSNKQINGMATAFKDLFEISAKDVMAYYASFSFIASIRMFVSFIFGETIRILNEHEQKDSLLLIKTLKEKEIGDIILPPAVGIPIFENEDLKLKYMILAGAELNELTNKKSNTQLVNFYGTTELIMAIVNNYNISKNNKSFPLGKAVANTWAYILDENSMPMPIGVPGEICIASEYLSPGYYNRPDLTNKSFVENINSTCSENKRMYRTGDIGFYNFDGMIEYISREDDQLSVRGFRIESNEILKIMKNFKEINNVYLDSDHDNLIAYYTTTNHLNIDNVKEALKLELPPYMIPSIFIKLDKIPLTANGKLDKIRLNKIIENGEEENIEIDDNVLKVVVNGFKEVLNQKNIFLKDDFIKLGGNSLSAMKLQIYLKEKLEVHLDSIKIIELKTPLNITDYIKFNKDIHLKNSTNYTFKDKYPLSQSQLNVYLDEIVNNTNTGYNNPFIIKFNKKYSKNKIEKTINKLYDIYPILLARVIKEKGEVLFSFDSKPQIHYGTQKDIKNFVQPFKLDKNLSKFLIVEEEKSNYLCFDIHHLIFDGSSINIILNCISSILEDHDLDLLDDGILRQISYEENLNEEYMLKAHEFFDSMLTDRDEVYELLDSVKTCKNEEYEYNDNISINNNELKSFLSQHSITANQFFCSAFAYTLSRFAGSSKILFNIIDNGRGHFDLSKSIGMFAQTLPLLIDCNNQNISSFLDYTSNLIKTAIKYDLYPFHILAKEYEIKSNIIFQYSHDLFNSLINNENSSYEVIDLKHDIIEDFSFFIFNRENNEYGIRILYSEKYSKEFVENFTRTYKLIIKEMMNVKKLSEINYTTDSDLKILDKYNQTEKDLKFTDILEAFNENLRKYPRNKLVSYNDISYSYGEGGYIADILAKELVKLGINLQDSVSFFVERSELYIFCVLGILSVGGVYVPLDDDLPDERIKFMIKDCASPVVIVSDETYNRGENIIKNIDENIKLLNISNIIKRDINTISTLPYVYGDLACILYTSGTTGVPKGVKITREGITNYVDFYLNEYKLKSTSTYSLFSSIGFDVSAIRGMCSPIYAGACLDIIPKDIRLNMHKLNKHFIEKNVTHTTLPTQVVRAFIEEIDETSLKVLITGGEKLGLVNTTVEYTFHDSYGPTECCVAVCAIDVNNKIDSSSIGHLFTNIKAYILDNECRRVPIGAIGELCIVGKQVAHGYLNRQMETEKVFVKNPFDDNENYGLMYYTGDLVRVLPDGTIGMVGRRDGQVKIRGNRVELSEVESIIRNMDFIKDVTVQTINERGNNELVAYVVVDNKTITDSIQKKICDYVSSYKPDYMVPSFIMILENIPLTVNGKVDKQSLPEVDRSSLQVEYVAPTNEKEREIVNAFEKIFNEEKISVYDDFLNLGGDSLTALKLLSYLKNYNITAADILNLRTPRKIAKNINDIPFDLDIYSIEEGCPLNEAQASLFSDIIVNDNFDFYQIPTYIQIPKTYKLEEILTALDKTINAHPIIKTHLSKRYESKEKKNLIARIKENLNLLKELGNSNNSENMSLLDLLREKNWNIKRIYDMISTILKLFKGEYPYLVTGSKPPITIESNFNKEIVNDFINENLDLYNYLSMFKIFDLEDSYILLAKFHHLIFDAISSNVFKQSMEIFLNGGKVDVDEGFLKMSAFNHQVKNTEKFSDAEDFFDSMLCDIEEVKSFVGDKQSKGFTMDTYDLEINHEKLKRFIDDNNISKNVLFTSAFSYTLSRFNKGDKVLFLLIGSGRGRFDDMDSIGLYANVKPLIINCKNQNIESFIKDSSKNIFGVTKYDFYPLLLLYQKYPLTTEVIFQYVPDWVSYDGINYNDEMLSTNLVDDILDEILEKQNDLMANFIVQVFQKGENYSMMIVNSNNYSNEMIQKFKNTFELILSNIINGDMSSKLENLINEI